MSHRRSTTSNAPRQNNPVSTLAGVGLATLLTIFFLPGCATPRHGEMVSFLRANETTTATGEYRIMPPDSITIHAPRAPEIDGVVQRLRPDGKVSLRLLGEVDLAGLTPEQSAEKLQSQLRRYYVAPEVVVEVSSYRSQHFYVFGEVHVPGAKTFTGRDTLLKALADAGLNIFAWKQRIRVIRPAEDGGKATAMVVDLDRMIREGNVDQNVLLQPGDIVEVPPTPLAWIGHRVHELLYPIRPAIDTYVAPTDVIDANDTYQGQNNGNDVRFNRFSQ